jgi:hypothetical protein
MSDAKGHLAVASVRPLKEDDAAQVMWTYYKDRKSQFVDHIREYRGAILSALMAGEPVEAVFAPYVRPAQPAKVVRKAH